MLVSTH